MTALPKRKPSTRRKGKRRASIKLALPKVVKCKHCKQPKKSHTQCPNCKK